MIRKRKKRGEEGEKRKEICGKSYHKGDNLMSTLTQGTCNCSNKRDM